MNKVVCFFDGQNLHKTLKNIGFPVPSFDILQLAQKLTNRQPNRKLEEIRFYTGVHDPNRNEHTWKWSEFWRKKLNAFTVKAKRADIEPYCYTRRVLYHGNYITVEKGIDIKIALDLVSYTRQGLFDLRFYFLKIPICP